MADGDSVKLFPRLTPLQAFEAMKGLLEYYGSFFESRDEISAFLSGLNYTAVDNRGLPVLPSSDWVRDFEASLARAVSEPELLRRDRTEAPSSLSLADGSDIGSVSPLEAYDGMLRFLDRRAKEFKIVDSLRWQLDYTEIFDGALNTEDRVVWPDWMARVQEAVQRGAG